MAVLNKARTVPPGGGLAEDVRLVTGTWSATLSLDLGDPYFFDHPLDRVPGMALISGLLDLVRSSDAGRPERSGARLAASFELRSFCELGHAVQLEVSKPAAGSTIVVRARQGGRVVCDGKLAFCGPMPTALAHVGSRQISALPVDRAMVHRRRSENVLVTGMVAKDGTRIAMIRRPPAGHRFAAASGRPLRAEALIDAAKQLGTMVSHLEHGTALDTDLVLLGVAADLPCGPRSDVYLRWHWTPPPRRQSRMVIEIVMGRPEGESSGSVMFDYVTAAPTMDNGLRDSRKAA